MGSAIAAGLGGGVLTAAGAGGVPVAALVPFILLSLAFVGYCLYDLSRNDVRHLPKWAWAIVCVISVPAGGIVYLILGRRHR